MLDTCNKHKTQNICGYKYDSSNYTNIEKFREIDFWCDSVSSQKEAETQLKAVKKWEKTTSLRDQIQNLRPRSYGYPVRMKAELENENKSVFPGTCSVNFAHEEEKHGRFHKHFDCF